MKFKLPSLSMGKLFKRNEYDPTQFQTINEKWDETFSSSINVTKNIASASNFQNYNLLLEENFNCMMKKLQQFNDMLPNIK